MQDKKDGLMIETEVVEIKEVNNKETTAVATISETQKKTKKEKPIKSNKKQKDNYNGEFSGGKTAVFSLLAKLLHKSEQEVIDECVVMQLKKLMSSAGKTIVRYSVTDEELKDFFLLADKFNFGEITVSPDLVSRCIKPVKKYDLSHVKVSTIIGFPFGDDTFSGKIVSLKQCVALGVDEASVAMKFKGGDKTELKLFKKQLKKINSCFSRRAGVALSAHDMEEKDLITAIKLIEKTDLNHVLLTFGECSFQDVKEKLEKVNKVKGKKAVKIMLNAKNPEDIKSVVELGASIVLTPYLDEIIKNLAKSLGVL